MENYSLVIEKILQTKKNFLLLGDNKEFNPKIYIDKAINELTPEDHLVISAYKREHYDAIESLYKKDRFNYMLLPNKIKNIMNSNRYDEHVVNAIQPSDTELILKTLSFIDIAIDDFCYELSCRTLLAQIIHFHFNSIFNFDGYENSYSLTKYEFIEVIGDCPTSCDYHISPLSVPYRLFSAHNPYLFINENNSNINIKNSQYSEKFIKSLVEYKTRFSNTIHSLLPLICIGAKDDYDLIEKKFSDFDISGLNII